MTTKLAFRDAGGGKPHSFADTDGLAGEEFTFVRKETGDYWTVNGGPRLGVNQTGNLTIRLDDGENTIRYYTNVPGIGYQTWYVVPPMAKVEASITASYGGVSYPLGSSDVTLRPHNKGTGQAELTFTISTDSGINAIYNLAIYNQSWQGVGGCQTSGITSTCNVSLRDFNGLYTARVTSWRMDPYGNKLDATQETSSDKNFYVRWNDPPKVEITGGSRDIVVRDGVVSLSATASDTDGTITSTEWLVGGSLVGGSLVGGSVVATGNSADIAVVHGQNIVTFRATDSAGESNSDTVQLNVNNAPVVAIAGGDRRVADTDGKTGETVSVSATATDTPFNVSSTEWLVGGSVVATGTSASLVLGDGANAVTFRATDNEGISSSRSVTITVAAANSRPTVSIIGGDRSVADTDGNAGETVSVSATAADSDGSVSSAEWLVGGTVVATGNSVNLSLSDGANLVLFRATDNSGDSSSARVTITVATSNASPTVSISGGDRTVADTDGKPGEKVSVSATATDLDGVVSSQEWLIGGSVVATGNSVNLSLSDGVNSVTFRATDNSGSSSSESVTITIATANASPTVSITGGDRSVADTDGNAGETVSVSATAADSDGSVSSAEWLVGGSVVATGTSASLSLSDGATVVTFRATDNDGLSSSKSVTIAVAAPNANVLPEVVIAGGDRTISDSNGAAGEIVSVSGTATDSDGSVSSTEWLIGGSVVATGNSANLSLSDGVNSVAYRATDNRGDSSSTSITITVAAPNAPPTVSISGGGRSVGDTDGSVGEVVSLSATASDSDGTVTSSQWLIGGTVVATGTSANLSLSDGTTSVTFRATDDDGDIASSTAIITVSPPSSSNVAPAIKVSWGNLSVADTDGRSGETVSFSATASDTDGSVASTQWLVGTSVAATGTSANLQLSDGATSVTFRATDDEGASSSATVTVNVLTPVESNPAPMISLIEVTNPIGTTSQGDTTILDSDDSPGEKVFVSATAMNSDGSSPTTEWLVNGSVVATGQTAHLSLSDGINAVMFRATNNGGGSASATITVTVSEPLGPNVAPVATIAGGNGSYSTVVDSDGIPGETVSFSATVTDSDGSIVTTEWWVSTGPVNEVAATGTDVSLRIPDGGHYQVVLRVVDERGAQTLAEVFVRVLPPSSLYPPKVEITYEGANPLPDSDGLPGEKITIRTQASDSDGPAPNGIDSATLLINGEVYRASDYSSRDIQGIGGGWDLQLQDGVNTVTYRATDKDGEIRSDSVTITIEPPNVSPVIEIVGGNRSIADTDGADGETVSLSATATDSDGSVASSEWLVAGEVVAQGTSAELSLSDGATVVTFRAMDDEGAVSSTNATITVAPNLVPKVTISEGDRRVQDSDGVPGETISLSATASDVDGSIKRTQWLISDEVISNGPIVIKKFSDGDTVVTFTATDDRGLSTSASVTVSISAPNVPPVAGIVGGSRSVGDTDGIAGEIISLSATAVDSDGSISSTEWLVSGEIVATGTSVKLPLKDGITEVTFRVTDDDGEQANTSVTITVSKPVDSEEEFSSDYNGIPAPSFLSKNLNSISVFDAEKLKLRSCIKLTLNGEPYLLDGYQRYDMNFDLANVDEATFKLVKFRPFNVEGAFDQFGESPDCSGQFELSTNVYKDIVAVPTTSAGGNLKYTYYDLILDLADIDSLLFKLRNILIIEEN